MARATHTKTVKIRATVKRPHFAIRPIRNANPRAMRASGVTSVLSRIFTF